MTIYCARCCAMSCHERRKISSSGGTADNYADARALRFDWIIIVGNTRKYNIESRKLSQNRLGPAVISI